MELGLRGKCALVCAAMLGYAIYAEKVLGLLPCPLCMFQRVCIGTLGVVFLIAGLHRVRYHGAIVYGGFLAVFAGAAVWVAGRHVWIHCARNMRVSAFVYLYRRLRRGEPDTAARHPMDDVWAPAGTWREFIERALEAAAAG